MFGSIYLLWIFACKNPEIPQKQLAPLYPSDNHDRAKMQHLLLSYEGAFKSKARRSKEDAQNQIQDLHQQLLLGDNFDELCARLSEDPSKHSDGLVVQRGEMLPDFEAQLFALQINEYSEPFESIYGFHLIQRLPLEERRLTHILLPNTEEGHQLSTEFFAELNEGMAPQDLAPKFSVGPHGQRGGELGWFEAKDLNPVFQEPVFALEIHQCTSKIAKDEYLHIFCREE